jgi:hypothetical protein
MLIKCKPSDTCTKIGLSTDTFERHARTILGQSMVVDINNVAVARIFRNYYMMSAAAAFVG